MSKEHGSWAGPEYGVVPKGAMAYKLIKLFNNLQEKKYH
jgi:hypothetical protein